MRLRLAFIAFVAIPATAIGAIRVPHFKDLSAEEVCGRTPPNCQPTSSRKWAKVKGTRDYDGEPRSILGRRFKTIFETYRCIESTVRPEDTNSFGKTNIHGEVSSGSANDLSAEITANIAELIRLAIPSLSDNVKASFMGELDRAVKSSLAQSIDLTYERIDLKQDFMDANLESCLATVPKSQNVATGISVISVSGEWTRTRVTDMLAKLEASAAYQSLSANVKATYARERDLLIAGNFPATKYVFAVAYRKGQKASN